LDFADGTVVHINSDITSLVAAIVVGKRVSFGKEILAPHNLTYSGMGAALLWVGLFGFNAGSALTADGVAGMAIMVTQVATAAGALTWMFVEWGLRGKPSVLGIITGGIAGHVAITPASGFVGPGGAPAIGIAAGLVCYDGATWLKNRLGYDDPLDVFAVHGLGGITGAILTGVFAVEAIGGTAGAVEGNIGQIWT
jgi:Amt family ammonium transporter